MKKKESFCFKKKFFQKGKIGIFFGGKEKKTIFYKIITKKQFGLLVEISFGFLELSLKH